MANVTIIPSESFLQSVLPQSPEQLHPAQINYADFNDNAALKSASDALGFASEGVASIDRLRANSHPEDRPATQARKVREAVSGFDNARAARWDGARAALKAELTRVESELEKAANLKPIESRFNSIVGTLQGMNHGQRAQTIDQLIEAGDGPSLATIIEAPLFLTGLVAEQRDNIKLRLFTKVDPAGLALRDQLVKATAKFETASIVAIHASAKLLEGTDAFDKKAREVDEMANKARTGFAA